MKEVFLTGDEYDKLLEEDDSPIGKIFFEGMEYEVYDALYYPDTGNMCLKLIED